MTNLMNISLSIVRALSLIPYLFVYFFFNRKKREQSAKAPNLLDHFVVVVVVTCRILNELIIHLS